MKQITYKKENDVYRLYEDEKAIVTPGGNPIFAETEELAKQLVEAFSQGKNYTSGDSLLTYHYTYCNLVADYQLADLIADYSDCMNYDNLMADAYLMFRQSSPVRQSIASYISENSIEFFANRNYRQLAAILTLYTIMDSWAFPYYVVCDLAEKANTENYAELRDCFLGDLVEVESEEFEIDPDSQEYKRHLKSLGRTIDMFVHYFNL